MRIAVKIICRIVVCRQTQQGFILEHKIAEAVKNRFALENFYATQRMWSMADKHIGAGLYHCAGKHWQEVSGDLTSATVFVRMDRHDCEIRNTTRIVDDSRNFPDIVLVDIQTNHGVITERKVFAENFYLTGRIFIDTRRFAVLVDKLSEYFAGLAQACKFCLLQHVSGFIT